MPNHFLTTRDGILGEGLWREMLHINPGYGLHEIMELILFLKYSYVHHYMEGESMRVVYEPWFVEYKADVVFAGHVHAYERPYNTKYVYVVGIENTNRQFWFVTPHRAGIDVPYTFGLIGRNYTI
ncbi:hypothetical protein CRYUN_Cryun30bG0018300 [Craigia yunnanensis]